MSDRTRDLLTDASSRGADSPLTISIRDLLASWGAKRRGYWIVDQIQRDLEQWGLTTDPPFTEGWIDSKVALVTAQREEDSWQQGGSDVSGGQRSAETQESTDGVLPQASLRVDILPSANLGVTNVTPEDSLERAQSRMLRYDYSQLAVMSGPRSLRGAVSWESIAQARIRDPYASLQDAVIRSEVVHSDDDLLAQVPKIAEAGFVFVQASATDRLVTGIVTTADLSHQFRELAKPFFVLGEIERRLRRILNDVFSVAELKEVADSSDTSRTVESPADLTLGECVRLLDSHERWSRLPWRLDRKVFIDALDDVRQTRNEVMHFSPDPLDDEAITQMENFLKWLKRLDPRP